MSIVAWDHHGTNTVCSLIYFVGFDRLLLRDIIENLQVQWGSQDHYEIVRKVGRGKYSEVSQILFISYRDPC